MDHQVDDPFAGLADVIPGPLAGLRRREIDLISGRDGWVVRADHGGDRAAAAVQGQLAAVHEGLGPAEHLLVALVSQPVSGQVEAGHQFYIVRQAEPRGFLAGQGPEARCPVLRGAAHGAQRQRGEDHG